MFEIGALKVPFFLIKRLKRELFKVLKIKNDERVGPISKTIHYNNFGRVDLFEPLNQESSIS